MKIKKVLFLIFIFTLFSILFWYSLYLYNSNKNSVTVYLGNRPVEVTLARTPQELAHGLSDTDTLEEGNGMLFVFPETGHYGFWMKDMKYSLDILWLDKNKKIVYIKENATPQSYPESYGSEVESMYVLEVPSGFVKKHIIQIGDTLEFK